jgi:SAM-dependent methyltransferase
MGLGIAAVQNTLELWQQGFFKNTKNVIEMGSQELHLKAADFEELVEMAGVEGYKSGDFTNLGNWPCRPLCSSKPLYQMLGIEEYHSLDLNEQHGAIAHDYNLPLEDTSLYSKFDLVTDHGSCEHAFNIGEAYRTMHRLCKPGGLIVIAQNLWGGNGYYCFDKPFFEGLAAANNYKILYSSYIIATNAETSHGSGLAFHVPMNRELLKSMDLTKVKEVNVYGVLQKQTEADFEYPYQGHYSLKKQGHFAFNRLFFRDPPSYSYIPVGMEQPTQLIVKLLVQRIINKVRSKLPL